MKSINCQSHFELSPENLSSRVAFYPAFSIKWLGAIGFVFLLLVSSVSAVQPATQKKTRRSDKEPIKIPPARNITLETKDYVLLKCTYLEAPLDPEKSDRKSVVPFILVHDWGGTRQDMEPFGKYLQRLGHTVIIPDLRGHGESTTLKGSTNELDYDRFRKAQLVSVGGDLETCKRFLVQKNNDAELNIDLLNIVAVGETCVFAINWAINDWNWPPVGGIKQGQDVKSVTLISPKIKLKNLNLIASLKHPLFSGRGNNLPTLVVWGQRNSSAAKDGREVYELMEKGRPDPSEIEDPRDRNDARTLFKAEIPNSSLTGTELIRDNSVAGFWDYLARFVDSQVVARKDDYLWQSRSR